MSCQSNSGLMQNRFRLSVTVWSTHSTQVDDDDDDDDKMTRMMTIVAVTVLAIVVTLSWWLYFRTFIKYFKYQTVILFLFIIICISRSISGKWNWADQPEKEPWTCVKKTKKRSYSLMCYRHSVNCGCKACCLLLPTSCLSRRWPTGVRRGWKVPESKLSSPQ